MTMKTAVTDHPVHALIAQRWSPYAFSERLVTDEDLRSVFEAARWAASSYNEQPWHYIIAKRDQTEAFEKLLSALVPPNQAWAKDAAALALGVVSKNFKRNGKTNKAAFHDLGLASAQLTLEATSRGLVVHQMIGILPDSARELYDIPDDAEALTALAIGYAADPGAGPEALAERDSAERTRRPLSEFVFRGSWGRGADLG
jgi:nitroreductase